MVAGLRIRRLVATGIDVAPAELRFRPGLNVVAGASNTGKSYILGCIDYLLGGTRLDVIDEAAAYSTLSLELQSTTDDEVFTVRRSVHGGDVRLYRCAIDDCDDAEPIELGAKHADEGDNISTLLLQKSGFGSARLRKNDLNKTVSLTLRTISHFFVVSEERIIAKMSPVHGPRLTDNTKFESAFTFLLTGRDQSGLTERPNPKLTRAATAAKQELLTSLLNDVRTKLAAANTTREDAERERAALERQLDVASTALATTSAKLTVAQEERRRAWEERATIRSRRMTIRQLQHRFSVLHDFYTSDMRRLDFITEADDLFAQLQAVACPLCGTDLKVHQLVEHTPVQISVARSALPT